MIFDIIIFTQVNMLYVHIYLSWIHKLRRYINVLYSFRHFTRVSYKNPSGIDVLKSSVTKTVFCEKLLPHRTSTEKTLYVTYLRNHIHCLCTNQWYKHQTLLALFHVWIHDSAVQVYNCTHRKPWLTKLNKYLLANT